MTRIIAGRAGSLTLVVPDAGTRPTSDRVRESLFGALESADLIQDAGVLDLYAGSGALALEAVSRGAVQADLVEKSPRAAGVADRNARAVGRAVPDATIRVHRTSADAFLRSTTLHALADAGARFDLVFLDPPYDISDSDIAATLTLLRPRLRAGAAVIIERSSRSPEPVMPPGLTIERSKTYGDTTLWWAFAD